ncbi:MAG: transposase [Candidatus Electronema sp. V4]|uniref:transposase n=1 Tax=Candidatus Electronema sp. V4 TaxID=3454756 RepID=UPI0040558064
MKTIPVLLFFSAENASAARCQAAAYAGLDPRQHESGGRQRPHKAGNLENWPYFPHENHSYARYGRRHRNRIDLLRKSSASSML